jgi:hypothetical protein
VTALLGSRRRLPLDAALLHMHSVACYLDPQICQQYRVICWRGRTHGPDQMSSPRVMILYDLPSQVRSSTAG